jgi:hypothetical protein
MGKQHPSTIEDQIQDFRNRVGDSKYAKLHKISGPKIEKATERMKSSLSLCSSLDVLSISGSNKFYMAMDSSKDAAASGSASSLAQSGLA